MNARIATIQPLGERTGAALAALARTFPSLAGADGVSAAGFDPTAFDAWAASDVCYGQAYFAATFVLSVCAPGHPWQAGTFNATTAMVTFDDAHRMAFLAWATRPWAGEAP